MLICYLVKKENKKVDVIIDNSTLLKRDFDYYKELYEDEKIKITMDVDKYTDESINVRFGRSWDFELHYFNKTYMNNSKKTDNIKK